MAQLSIASTLLDLAQKKGDIEVLLNYLLGYADIEVSKTLTTHFNAQDIFPEFVTVDVPDSLVKRLAKHSQGRDSASNCANILILAADVLGIDVE